MYKHLTSEQRYAIYLGLQKGDSEKMIAELIKVNRSTVSREKRRNSTANGKYVWVKAQADRRKRRTPGNRRILADSYCAWQKGAIENENKLVRQYIPKGTDLSTVTNGKIDKIRKKINARPREKLNFLTPTEAFFKNFP